MHVSTLGKEQKTCQTPLPYALCAGQDIEMTGPALRLVGSVFTLLWGRTPWGRGSLRLRELYHFDTQFADDV